MMNAQHEVRRRLERAISDTGLSASALAKRARVAHTTITRFLGDPEWPTVPTSNTVAKIEAAAAYYLATTLNRAHSATATGSTDIPTYRLDQAEQAGIIAIFEMLTRDQIEIVLNLARSLGTLSGLDASTPHVNKHL